MKTLLSLLLLLALISPSLAQDKKWATNIGIEVGTDAAFGLAGVSLLNVADNPLVNSDLKRFWAANAGLYFEFLKLNRKSDIVKPTFGFKTKIEYNLFDADNSKESGGEELMLNSVGVPLLFEICLGHSEGIETSIFYPGSTTYKGTRHSDNSVTITEQSTPGSYSRGGGRTSWGTFIYFGPKMCYLFKSLNTGKEIEDENFVKNYTALVGGITFYRGRMNLDLSYQKGMTSIYKGRDITIDGFLVTLGINFNSRVYN